METELEQTRSAIHAYPESLKYISEQAGVGIHWLKAYVYGYMKEPSYVKIRRLQEFLRRNNVEPLT